MTTSDKDLYRAYEEKKTRLCDEVQERTISGASIALQKDTSNLFRSDQRSNQTNKIDVRSFNKILSVDPINLVAEVEGMATYEDIVKATLLYGCLPTVVPELKSITVGGALAGGGIESSSFRYGLVHETVKEFEVLLSDGRVITCSPTNEHSDLFFAFPNSYGTLGYALKVKIQLIPTKKYVKLRHISFSNSAEYFKEMTRLCIESRESGPIAYIDGVIFDHDEMYITLGELTDEAPFVSSYRYMDIYYRSIQKKQVDYLTTLDYIWRWDPDWFWCSKVFFMQNPVMRFLFGKFMLSSESYTRIMKAVDRRPWLRSFFATLRGKRESIIQDVLIPMNNTERFFTFFKDEIGIKPIWICPTYSYSKKNVYTLCPLDNNMLYFDFGFWDSIKAEKKHGFYNRKIEKKVANLKGFKSLYSASYYTENEFWSLYDKDSFLRIKEKYDLRNALKGLYEKCSKEP